MARCQMGWGWSRCNPFATFRPAILSKFEASLMQPFLFLLFVPFRAVIVFFASLNDISWRRKKHTSPLRKMHQCNRDSATHYHHPHQGKSCCCWEACATEEDQLGQPRPKIPACPCQTRYDTQWATRYKGYDAKSGSACGLRPNGEEDHCSDSKGKGIGTAQPYAE